MADKSLIAAILASGAIQNPNFELTNENAVKIVEFYARTVGALVENEPIRKAQKRDAEKINQQEH